VPPVEEKRAGYPVTIDSGVEGKKAGFYGLFGMLFCINLVPFFF
jgi:hypothetical protein